MKSSQSTGSTSSSTQGAYNQLSTGNHKIAQALCNGQTGGCPSSGGTVALTLNQIAAMKQPQGWGEIFKQMKADRQIPSNVKNLGQLVSGRDQKTSGGTTITTASGHIESGGEFRET